MCGREGRAGGVGWVERWGVGVLEGGGGWFRGGGGGIVMEGWVGIVMEGWVGVVMEGWAGGEMGGWSGGAVGGDGGCVLVGEGGLKRERAGARGRMGYTTVRLLRLHDTNPRRILSQMFVYRHSILICSHVILMST